MVKSLHQVIGLKGQQLREEIGLKLVSRYWLRGVVVRGKYPSKHRLMEGVDRGKKINMNLATRHQPASAVAFGGAILRRNFMQKDTDS